MDDPAVDADAPGDAWTVHSLPDDLVDAARAADAAGTRAAVEETTAAFETRNGGSQVEGRAAFPEDDAYDALVDALVDVIAPAYDDVRREDGRVVAETEAFDPALASEAGVPEGPKFGRLASGEAVEMDGETVHPGDVSTDRTDVFEI